MRHGLTLGEMARLARADLGIARSDLVVVPVAGWSRTMAFDQTGLPFVPPSPNLRTLESLYHYPGTCLFEGTNLSVGRGSDAPFEQIGAPWLDTAAILAAIRKAELPGVRVRAVTFTPSRPGDGKYVDTLVAGIRLEVADRPIYDPTVTAVHLSWRDREPVESTGFHREASCCAVRRTREAEILRNAELYSKELCLKRGTGNGASHSAAGTARQGAD